MVAESGILNGKEVFKCCFDSYIDTKFRHVELTK